MAECKACPLYFRARRSGRCIWRGRPDHRRKRDRKSEAALELIKRGHRLVTDDAVEIRKVSDETLIGSAPDITKHFIELRGIGIVDVKTLFGVSSVKDTQSIDLVIRLEDWDKEKEYDRLGLEEEYTEYLGNKVVCHNIPIRPGRNLAIICESAAINHRQKRWGTMQRRSCTEEFRNPLPENGMRMKSDPSCVSKAFSTHGLRQKKI